MLPGFLLFAEARDMNFVANSCFEPIVEHWIGTVVRDAETGEPLPAAAVRGEVRDAETGEPPSAAAVRGEVRDAETGEPLPAAAVRGEVRDAETGEPLPAAAILLIGTYRGTTTNQEGAFTLTVDSLPAALMVRYIGYEQQVVSVEESHASGLLFLLQPVVTEMPEIVITAEDPAMGIMERVIIRKQIWRANLYSYEALAYTRQVLSSDTLIVSISESGTRAWWDVRRGRREEQIFTEQTSNLSSNQNFAGISILPNFYDDDLDFSGFTIMGVTHPQALDYYQFRLLGASELDGKPLYKIQVIPARRLQPLFEGTVWVLGEEYAMLEAELKPNETVRFPPPVRDFDLYYRQQFSNYGGQFWLPVDMRIEGVVGIALPGLRFPAIRLEQVSQVSDYRVNEPVPDSIYRQNRLIVRMDTEAAAGLIPGINRIPLSEREEVAYATIDSTSTLEEAFQPEGRLARHVTGESSGRSRKFSLTLPAAVETVTDALSPVVGYNRIGGYFTGISMAQNFRQTGFSGRATLGYHFHLKEVSWNFEARQRLTPRSMRPALFLNLHTGSGLARRLDSGLYPKIFPDVIALLGGPDYFDYYDAQYAEISLRRSQRLRIPGMGLRRDRGNGTSELLRTYLGIQPGIRLEKYRSYESVHLQHYSLFGWHAPRRENPAVDDGRLNSLFIRFWTGEPSRDRGLSGDSFLVLEVEQSLHSPAGGSGFSRMGMSFSFFRPTWYTRRLFANVLHVRGKAGYTLGDLPLQRMEALDGSLGGFGPFGVLKTRIGVPYEGDRYAMLTAEHDFQSIPFEMIGLNSFADRGWGVILFAGAGYSDVAVRKADRDTLFPSGRMTTGKVHLEAGLSLNRLFSIARVDAALRLDRPGFFAGVSVPRYF